MSKVNIVWDATLFTGFIHCPEFYKIRHKMNKSTPTKPRALDKGGVMHVGMENYYKGLQAESAFEVCLDKALMSIRIALTDSDLSSDDGNHCLQVMEEYAHRWRVEDKGWKITAVESPFSFTLYEDELIRIIWIGKIDLLWSNHQYTDLPVDHKTYERDFTLSRLSDQFTGYAYATNSNFLLVNRVGFQTSLKPEAKHKRVPLSYDPIFKEQWKQNVVKWAYIYYDCMANDSFPMNATSCFKYGRMCEYSDICNTTGDENKLHKLNVNFITIEPWDVSKILTSRG